MWFTTVFPTLHPFTVMVPHLKYPIILELFESRSTPDRFSKLHCNMVHYVALIHRFHTYSTLQCAPPSYVCRFINPMNSIAYYSCKVSLTLVKPELLDVFLQLSFSLAPKMGRFQLVPRQNALRCMEDAGPLIGRSLGA